MIELKKLARGRFAAFQSNNPDLDWLHYDFIDPRHRDRIDWSGQTIEDKAALLAYQRIHRLTGDPELAERLMDCGLTSAHHIARGPENLFVAENRDRLGVDGDALRRLHRAAVQTKIRAQMLGASFKSSVGSALYRAGKMNNADAAVDDYLQALPSYQDFFGSLDYCRCPHEMSIFGPAAYLVDILRVVYQAIDNPTLNPQIPDGWHLKQRRPDIENIPLTEEMTLQLVPYLQIINEVLAAFLVQREGWTDVFRTFAGLPYPFSLPFILPLTQTRAFLDGLGASLLQVYQACRATPASPPAAKLPTSLQIGREGLLLSPTQAEVVTTRLTDRTRIGVQYGVADGRILAFQAVGAASVVEKQDTLTGQGTQFTRQVKVNDQVQVDAQRRTVVRIESDTELTVGEAWVKTVSDRPLTVFPATDLGLSVEFNQRTGLTFAELRTLITQQLDGTEVAAGVPGKLFINTGQAGGQYLDVEVDRSDPERPISRIVNQDLNTLDRLNRFIRLSRVSGIGFADLDWLIQTVGGGQISQSSLGVIGRAKLLADTLGAALDETVALFGPVKTIGVQDSGRPADLFDRLFNSPAVLGSPDGSTPAFTATGTVSVADNSKTVTGGGTAFTSQVEVGMRVRIQGAVRVVGKIDSDAQLTVTAAFAAAASDVPMVVIPSPQVPSDALPVYHPDYAENPLYTDPVIDWDPLVTASADPNVRGRLRAALGVSDDELTLIGIQALSTLPNGTTRIELSVPNMSLLYGYAKLAQLTRLSVGKFIKLLNLLGIGSYDTLDGAINVTDWAQWLRESQLNPFALEYALSGTTSKEYTPVLTLAQLPNFLASTWVLADDWLIHSDGFVNEDIGEETSRAYFEKLIDPQHAFMSKYGAVLEVLASFRALSFVDPVPREAFITPLITAEESSQAWKQLVAHGVLDSGGLLSADYGPATDLGYLFDGNPKQAQMIAEVRSVLNATQRRIEHVVSVLATYGGAPTPDAPNQGVQRFHLSEQLAVLLRSTTDTMLELGPCVAARLGLENYVAAFLQPPSGSPGHWDPPPRIIQDFMKLLSRLVTLANQLKLTSADVAIVIRDPKPFELDDLSRPTIDSVRALWTYKQLERDFDDTERRLAAYFAANAAESCRSDPKMQILSTLTGWPPAQICVLREALFGTGDGYNSVAGVTRMQACFETGDMLGLDMDALLEMASLNALPAEVDEAVWSAYASASTAAVSSFKARHGGPGWEEAYRPVLNSINEAKRDPLAEYSLFALNAEFPSVTNMDDLYNHLLIDVEMSGCADISYIKQAILSVQLYMQRAHLMLEPGISHVQIPEVWWTWLASYRLWEANRKIFLYPENYLEPGLRKDKTPQFQDAQDSLVSNDITPRTVNETYVTYFESFTELAALKQVGAFYGAAPDPDAVGALSPTLFVLSRTPTEPYTYYLQRRVNNSLWTAFEKIELSVPSPVVAPIYAFDRLMLFWAEQDATSVSQVKSGDATNSTDTRATVKFSFVNYSGKWTQPQTLDQFVIDFDPMQSGYKTNEVNPADFDTRQQQWRTISPLLVKGSGNAPDRILITYGLFYDLPGGTPNPPVAPDRSKIPNPDAWELATTVYESSRYAVSGTKQGIVGVTYVNQGRFLDAGLNVSPTYVIAANVFAPPQPYFPMIPRVVLEPGQIPTLRIFQIDNTFLLHYLGQGAQYTFFPPGPPVSLLFNISDRAGYSSPVVNQPFWFIFDNGDESFLLRSTEPDIKLMEDILALNQGSERNQSNLISKSYTSQPQEFNKIVWSTTRLSTGAVTRMNQALYSGGVPSLLSPRTQVTPQEPLYPFSRFYDNGVKSPNLDPPKLPDGDTIDYDGPYGLYFWEIFLNIPWLVSNQLKANQRYEAAKQWLEYIFNPTIPEGADPTVTKPEDRYWRLVEFRDFTVESLRDILTNPAQIAVYNNYPFQPHAIARLRHSAYQKAIVMRYIDLLLEWGDFEFTRDTWESLTTATLLYIVARELLGPKPANVGPCSTEPPATFKEIREKYGDDIPQFLIDMENAVGHMELTENLLSRPDRYVPFNELDSYFCVPENKELNAYWDKVEDRLYKIRHCMNIQGVVRKLALFEPPIDPHALVRAAAAGGPQVVSQLQASAPAYRFSTVFAIARDFAGQLTQIGGLLLSTLEKKDAESLATLRAGQETRILNLTTKTIELQIQEVEESLTGLNVSRKAALARQSFYQGLIDDGLLPAEELQVAMVILSNVLSATGALMKGLAAVGYLVPNVGSPFAMTYGGRQIGGSVTQASEVFNFLGSIAKTIGDVSQMVAGFQRREQDWQLQLSQSTFDVQQLDSQIAATNLQLQNLQRQLEVHKQSIANSIEIENFLKDKFTNAELYQWMIGRISAVYGQAYRLALELSIAAQQAYQFELNQTDQFINFEYWNSARKGLLAGEQLMLSLSQMQKAYYQKNSRSLEVEKTISLLAQDPRALLALKTDGTCDFSLSEYLFDLDYPGQYARQVKSVSITIPAVVGPNQNIKATLTQLGNQILIKAGPEGLAGVDFLLGLGAETPDTSVLRSNWRANQKIALSTGVDDSGMFQLDFNDDRYLPFEGTGAVSSWRLEMPKSSNLIDFDSISDVVIRLRYTALDGGSTFAAEVKRKIDAIPYVGQRAFNLGIDFPSSWYAFMHPQSGADRQSLQIEMLPSYFPPNLTITQLKQIYAQVALEEGVSLGGQLIATLEIGAGAAKTTETLIFDAKTGIAEVTGLSIAQWLGLAWTINVSKNDVPPGIQDPENGLIDPGKLLSIGLLLGYGADRAPVKSNEVL